MFFNNFVYLICFAFSSIAALLHVLDRSLRSQRYGGSAFVRNEEFVSFRRRYFVAYLLCLFADSLQAPYLYYLYNSYGFLEYQIAMLYVSGFVTNIIFSLVCVYLVERVERKLLCTTYAGICALSCLMKVSTNYGVLLVSRIFDGIAGALLAAPFQEWYLHEHIIKYDFPKEWIPVTFRFAGMLAGYAAIGAGFLAEFTEGVFKVTAGPFLLSVPILIAGGLWICSSWDANRQDKSSRKPLLAQLARAVPVLVQDPSALLLSIVQALFESCLYMFVFLWTPIFLHVPTAANAGDRVAFGALYSSFMASALCGRFVQRILSRKFSPINLLCMAVALSFIGLTISVTVAYPVKESVLKFEVLLLAFTTYEMGVGLYVPTMQRLQKDLLPAEHRGSILSLFRIPVNLIAACGLLVLHGHEMYGNWMLLIICMILVIVCVMLSLLLQGTIRRGSSAAVASASERFVMQLQVDGDDEDVY